MTQSQHQRQSIKENLRICEDVQRGLFHPHMSKARTRLTTALIIVPGFSRQAVGRFIARHLGDFMHRNRLFFFHVLIVFFYVLYILYIYKYTEMTGDELKVFCMRVITIAQLALCGQLKYHQCQLVPFLRLLIITSDNKTILYLILMHTRTFFC